ncbi:uncharacterized protein LOC131845450 [Achroia grisella]|uniref:uncharacterized protein LOC131845450 n=1 Tax=Achroia grisella TaxID=688607 RepID=UPI0027D23589|nr:uncharacterized protein LOC131845450 [Achroia grisella]
MCKKYFLCSSCPTRTTEEIKVNDRAIRRTPIDRLGFTFKCCCCIPLRLATILICLNTFVWTLLELQGAKKFIANLFENETIVYYTSIVYIFLTVCLILASGVLMFGIIIRSYDMLNIYVWYAFIYNCVYIIVYIISVVFYILKTGELSMIKSMKIIGAILWNCLFFYYVQVVNSYKMTIW